MLQQAERHSTDRQTRHELARAAKLHGVRRPIRKIWDELHQDLQDYLDGLIYEEPHQPDPEPQAEVPPILPTGWEVVTGEGDDDDLRLATIFGRWAA
jgi:hypothetical protein